MTWLEPHEDLTDKNPLSRPFTYIFRVVKQLCCAVRMRAVDSTPAMETVRRENNFSFVVDDNPNLLHECMIGYGGYGTVHKVHRYRRLLISRFTTPWKRRSAHMVVTVP